MILVSIGFRLWVLGIFALVFLGKAVLGLQFLVFRLQVLLGRYAGIVFLPGPLLLLLHFRVLLLLQRTHLLLRDLGWVPNLGRVLLA